MAAESQHTSVEAQIKHMHDLMADGSDDLPNHADDLVHDIEDSEWSVEESPADFAGDCMSLTAYVDEATVQWFSFAEVDRRNGMWIPRRGSLIVEGHVDGKEVFIETEDDAVPCPDVDAVLSEEKRAKR